MGKSRQFPWKQNWQGLENSQVRCHEILGENNIRVRTSEEVITSNRKYKRTSFNSSGNEKAYLIGFTEGDITVFKKSKYTIGLITHSTHNSFTDLIKRCFSRYGNVKISPAKNKSFGGYMWRITTYLDNSFDFLLPSERKKFVEELSNSQYEGFLHFLAGLIDSDGSIIIRKVYNNFQFVIRIFGENAILLKGIKNKLESLGFKPHLDTTFKLGHTRKYENIILRYNNNYSTLELSNRKDILRLIKDLPIRHSEKIPKKDLIIQITKNKFKNWSEIKDDIEKIREKIDEDLREGLGHAEELYAKLHPDFNLQV